MPATLTTNNPNGLGQQTNVYTLPTGTNVSAAFADRLFTEKIYRDIYFCDVVNDCTMSTFLDQFGGTEYDCHLDYSTLEYNGFRHQIKVKTDTTIAATGTDSTITLSTSDHSVSGAYYEPVVGNSIVLINGALFDITSINHSAANTTVLTGQQRGTAAVSLTANTELPVAPGKIITSCDTPSGQFRVPALPLQHDYTMVDIADGATLCGEDLVGCQYFHIPFLQDDGTPVPEKGMWFTPSEQEMYRGLERRKYYERLLNATFGLIPTIKSLGMKFTPATSTEITIQDIRDFVKQKDRAGVRTTEYAIFAGTDMFSQWQAMLLASGVAQLNFLESPAAQCKFIDMNYCGISIEGLRLHIYKDCSFSNGKGLGAEGMVFPSSAIWVPLDDRPMDTKYSFGTPNRNGDMYNKKFTTVYWQGTNGMKFDMWMDSNGVLGPRNSLPTGTIAHEWSWRTVFTFEIHCAQSYVYQGL